MKKFLFTCFLVIACIISWGQNFVAFRAIPPGNGSRAGHAWIAFIKKDEIKKQTIVEESWGFHPVEQSLKALFSEEGKFDSEGSLNESGEKTIGKLGKYDFVVEVKDTDTYEALKGIKLFWKGKKYGVVANQNCVDFVKQVAESIPGVKVPVTFLTYPHEFLYFIKTLNRKIDSESRKSFTLYKPIVFKLNQEIVEQEPVISALCPNGKMKWIGFSEITNELKNDLNKMRIYEDLVKLKQFYHCEPAIARTDLDNNGKGGFAIGIVYGGTGCCGTLGCQFEVRESDGKSLFYLETDICSVRMTQGGILTSANRFVKLENENNQQSEINSSDLLGSSDPERLAEILFKAIQNDDKKTWVRCILPDVETSFTNECIQGLASIRERLKEQGLTNWSAVKFSRVTYSKKEDWNNQKRLGGFIIEFTYKNQEFVGQIWLRGVSTLPGKSVYYLAGPPSISETGLMRNKAKQY